MIKVKWFGHSFWQVSTADISIVIDPFTDIGYNMDIDVTADVLLSSHDHFDHNNINLIKGNPLILRNQGKFLHAGETFELIKVWHDKQEGKQRGENLLIKFTVEGRSFLHCGDLGHIPAPDIIEKIKNIDVLMIPVGGVFTIDAQEAEELVKLIQPKVIFPMHYQTPALSFKLNPLADFLSYFSSVITFNSTVIELRDDLFTSKQIPVIIMNYE
ncbi:MAG: MBL fold metallo-hydrolase [Candidatus Cloacimonetes bacterium]|nr:MBL fold metallo-hydrolase [Candidatus Cloacimonadota bacterium]